MPAWRATTRLLTALLFGGTVILAGCGGDPGPAGPAGTKGADGVNGADGTNGTDGTSGTDGTNGTSGVDGTNGTDGVDGQDGKDYVSSKKFKDIDLKITAVSNDGGAIAVTFTALDNGNPVTNLTMAPIRMMINQYLPKANAYDNAVWSQDRFYEKGDSSSTSPATPNVDQRFVQSDLGTYTYTFLRTIQDGVTNFGVVATLPTQVAMRIRGFETYNSVNAIYQITGIPTTDGAVATKVAAPVGNIVETSACETCHGPGLGGGKHGYNKVEYCRNCHTRDDASKVTNGTDFATMIHQIHSAYDHKQGDPNGPGFNWSGVTYPQDTRNCDKCHKGVDGQNWNLLPTREACTSCHTTVSFVNPPPAGMTLHSGMAQATNQNCNGLCHDSAKIKEFHLTANATPNNPGVPAGAANFEYKIDSVTVDEATGNATVKFAILKDGAPITDFKTTYPPTGFTGGPGFLFAYSLPQDGIAQPADWNNKGLTQAQPKSVGLANALAGTAPCANGACSVSTPDANGVYTLTVNAAFPVGAKMRAAGINSYFTQVSPAIARHTASVVKEVTATGEAKRRAILNFTGCLDCHEELELHGGSRVINDKTAAGSVAVCTMCHNPNLSSSGNTFNLPAYIAGLSATPPATPNANTEATRAMFGDNALLWPEDSQNFKDLVHGIHSASVRTDPYEHVRIRSVSGTPTAFGFDWSEVTFPGDPSNCSKCHVGTTYAINSVPAGALASTKITLNAVLADPTATPTYQDALDARAGTSLPNAQDHVATPVVAACNGCHNGKLIEAHMEQNGAGIGMSRASMATAAPAQCIICHGTGSIGDIQLLHPGLN